MHCAASITTQCCVCSLPLPPAAPVQRFSWVIGSRLSLYAALSTTTLQMSTAKILIIYRVDSGMHFLSGNRVAVFHMKGKQPEELWEDELA